MANKEQELKRLIEIFKEAGAIDPESWASSEIEEGIPQLARFSFLKALTSVFLKETDLDWVNNQIEYNYSRLDNPCAQIVPALREMLDKNVSRESIIDLVRVIQFETLMHVCSTIDSGENAGTPISNWGIFQKDEEDDNPTVEISGLHESLLEFDPSGNEMRPRGTHN
jgi:hypothetical protein